MRWALVVCVVLAAASLGVAAPAPSYDPTAWLIWGREIVGWDLSTVEGPAFKPLPVAVCALLAPLGSAAPWLFVLIARAAALAALPLAFATGRRLAAGSAVGGALAAAGVALCGGAVALAAGGMTEGAVVALALAAIEAARRGRHDALVGFVAAASLLRVEAWPMLLAILVVAWRRGWVDRRLLGLVAIAVPVAWFVPEALGSGDPLRSGARARLTEPGQPAQAEIPFLASLDGALAIVPWPLWAGVALVVARPSWRAAALPAAVGMAWIVLVAVMAQAGFSGEPRYALPGAALVAVSGGAGLGLLIASLPRSARAPAAIAACAVLVLAAQSAVRDATRVPARQAYAHTLQRDLAALVAAQGRERLLACRPTHVGRLRGPMLSYALHVHREDVEPDDPPGTEGTAFRSALREGGPTTPIAPVAWPVLARRGEWEVRSTCTPGAAVR